MSSAVASKMDALTVHQTADLVAFSAAAKSDSFYNIAARIAFTINKNASGGEKLKGSKINQGVQSQKQSTLHARRGITQHHSQATSNYPGDDMLLSSLPIEPRF